ncbi:M3 family metallopeptidase [Mesoterricola sediminis]|uniref:Peptidase M3 n=1 Tax=Mesoterricola sediminis TaxID=2927980 RepID=A0AA48KAL8_9BACT|nr:M3 family metallopeptidase [Mesoterricola sediminis]BDU75199.1 peptidase M3 [Mesoterricola sediminis]
MSSLRTRLVLGLAPLVVLAAPLRAEQPVKPSPTLEALIAPWTGPYGGVPPWDKVKPADFVAAFDLAMADARKHIQAIATDPAAPTFQNTIEALERATRMFDRVNVLTGVHFSTLKTGEVPAIEAAMAPKLSAYFDEITQNGPLFKRIEAVYESRDKAGLTPVQKRLAWDYYTNFVRAGARLDPAQKTRIKALNQELASLFTRFAQNVVLEESEVFAVFDKESDLAGLSPDFKASLARAAEAKGLKGKWLVANTRSAMEPFLAYCDNRAAREKVWRNYIKRGDNDDARDTKALIPRILKLRFERAQLLGYKTHAHWSLEKSMAGTPEKAVALMEAVWKPAAAQVRKDVAEMQAIIAKEGGSFKLAAWDYRYYAEKLRKAKYDLDLKEVTPYMQLDKLREGMFWAANRAYGVTFHPVEGLPVQHPDVKVWEVKDARGAHLALWYFDPFARAGKSSGAWMNEYRTQRHFDGDVTPIVSNNSNFTKAGPGEPVLLSFDDAQTMFHEFGHALHGMLSNVVYPSMAGTNVARDFVEFPSQINEHFFLTPEVLNRFALHYKTGKPIPQTLVDRIKKAETFNQGFITMEFLASAMIDMKFHLAGGAPIDPARFEREELARLGMPEEIVMRHRPTQFNHIFSSDGYSAAYYSYLWADALTADAWEAFLENRGPWDDAVSERLKATVLSVGNTWDPADSFRAFRGRDVNTDALMRKRGFLK